MNIAYIISAYKLPEQLIRLVHRLQGDGASFFIHVDKKTPDELYRPAYRELSRFDNVFFLRSHVCHWGDFGHVEATLKGIDRLFATHRLFDYVILLTGQDYPIKSNDDIARYLSDHNEAIFMGYFALPYSGWPNGGLDRLQRRHFHIAGKTIALPIKRQFANGPIRMGVKCLNAVLPERSIPGGLKPFCGLSYWMLPRSCIVYVRDFIKRNPGYVRFFRRVLIPDELFFHTIVLNSEFKHQVTGESMRLTEWASPDAGGPRVLRKHDYDMLRRSPCLFARKFDPTIDPDILDMLDQEIAESGSRGDHT